MPKRFLSIWFRYLLTDHKAIRQKPLKGKPFVFAEPNRGRMVITAASPAAEKLGAVEGMVLADARAIAPGLEVFDGKPGRNLKLLKGLAEWCLRYTQLVAVDPPNGLLLDVTGCTHLKGGEEAFVKDLVDRLKAAGYDVRPGLADTIGCAWGVARCSASILIVTEGGHRTALMPLPPSALRLPTELLFKLQALGLYQISSFIHMPRSVLRRRFGKDMVLRMLQALWAAKPGLESECVAELLDRVAGKIGTGSINPYLPAEHFWPERSAEPTPSIKKKPESDWRTDKPRPVQLLDPPEPIEATALTPDYPPILFIYRGKKHEVKKADAPNVSSGNGGWSRTNIVINYIAEDQDGRRYWLFRSGHYDGTQTQHWYIHGFFA